MPRPLNTAQAAFMPAIEALRLDLADLEHRAANTRALLQGLCAHAGIAGEPATAPGEAAMASSALRQKASKSEAKRPTATGSAKTKARRANVGGKGQGKAKAEVSGGTKTEPPETLTLAELGVSKKQAKPNDDKASAEELSKVVGTIAEAASRVAAAKREKDAEGLRRAVASRARGERRAGELLNAMNGRVRPLPGEESDKRRWRAAVQLSPADFAKSVQRSQRRALAEAGLDPAPAKRTYPRSPPKLAMQLSDWQDDPADGSRSRTLTAVDAADAGAEAT